MIPGLGEQSPIAVTVHPDRWDDPLWDGVYSVHQRDDPLWDRVYDVTLHVAF